VKYGTTWWGVQFQSETAEDAKLLNALYDTLKDVKKSHNYDRGIIYIAAPEDGNVETFTPEEIEAAEITVMIDR